MSVCPETEVCVQRSETIRGLSRSQKGLIIESLLGSRDVRELADVPVFRLVSGATAALQTKHSGRKEVHVLLDAAAGLFWQFDANAINLHDVPTAARTLLINNGSKHLDVRPLDSPQCLAYVQAVQVNFSSVQGIQSQSGSRGWLSNP